MRLAKIFPLSNRAGKPILAVQKRAGKPVKVCSVCSLEQQIVLEFTLPMLVLRNYVLEPEYVIKGL